MNGFILVLAPSSCPSLMARMFILFLKYNLDGEEALARAQRLVVSALEEIHAMHEPLPLNELLVPDNMLEHDHCKALAACCAPLLFSET